MRDLVKLSKELKNEARRHNWVGNGSGWCSNGPGSYRPDHRVYLASGGGAMIVLLFLAGFVLVFVLDDLSVAILELVRKGQREAAERFDEEVFRHWGIHSDHDERKEAIFGNLHPSNSQKEEGE
jgi:hypothetical protein